MTVPLLDLNRQHESLMPQLRQAFDEVTRSGQFILGEYVTRFEQELAAYCGVKHAIGVASGTDALVVAMMAMGIGPGDEVITTPFSFIASANCILYVGARPVFVDINPTTLNLDPAKVEAAITENTKAILAVETFGNPADMDRLAAIAQRHEIPLIEDACEGLGGVYKGKPVGSFGRAAVFAFYPNKQITTGEGGMIVTDDDRLADLCRSMRNQGRAVSESPDNIGSWLHHERLGYNYRLSEINAAIGVVQMERLDEILEKRRAVAHAYVEWLMDEHDLVLPTIDADTQMSWFVYVIRLADTYAIKNRDRIITGMRRHEIGCSNYFPPIHLQPFYREKYGYVGGEFPATESVAGRTLALPFFNDLDRTQIELVCRTLKVMLQREQLVLRPDGDA